MLATGSPWSIPGASLEPGSFPPCLALPRLETRALLRTAPPELKQGEVTGLWVLLWLLPRSLATPVQAGAGKEGAI